MSDVGEIELQGVTMRFGGLVALEQVTASVDRETIHAVIGPNGAGKSTCFNVIAGVHIPTAGRVFYRGADVTELGVRQRARRGIARTFQHAVLCERLTVEDNVYSARHRFGSAGVGRTLLGTRRARRQATSDRGLVRRVLADLGLLAVLDRPVAWLDHQTRKRVEIARALAAEPSVVLLDEPAAGLDADETDRLATVLRRLRDDMGMTVIMIEHDMDLVLRVADRVTVLNSGRLIASGEPDAISRDQAVVDAYLGGAAGDGGWA